MVIAKVTFDYVADQPDELSLKVGDIVTNIKKEDGGWWEGEVNGKRGMFPENFVEQIEEEVKTPAPALPHHPALPGAKPAPPVVTAKKKFARVTFQYDAVQSDEISLEVGDLVEILDEDDEGWWKGKLKDKVGMFPSNFVDMIIEDEAPAEAPPLPQPIEPVSVAPPIAQPAEINTNRPKSGVGFGLSIGDLNRNKLKKTGKSVSGGEPPKPAEHAPPPSRPAEPEKKAVAPPVPAAPKEMTKSVQKAKVVFGYDPDQEDELKLNVGDVIIIVNKSVFEGWMQGEYNGKIGLFPENFVELLPLETVKVEENLETPKPINQQASVKRAAKANPMQDKPDGHPPQPEKPKFGMAGGLGGGMHAELQKKLAGGKPLAPAPPNKPPTKASKPAPGPPAKPTKPKPPTTHKPETPKSPKSPPTQRSFSSVSRHDEKPQLPFMNRTNSESRKNPPKPPPPSSASVAALPHKIEQEHPIQKVKEEPELDFDIVKPNEQLKHIQRAKQPSKNPPSKFKGGSGTNHSLKQNADSASSNESNGGDSEEVKALKKQVKDLQDKMSDMEKKFAKLTNQVLENIAKSSKEQSAQQIDIDTLKKRVEFMTD